MLFLQEEKETAQFKRGKINITVGNGKLQLTPAILYKMEGNLLRGDTELKLLFNQSDIRALDSV